MQATRFKSFSAQLALLVSALLLSSQLMAHARLEQSVPAKDAVVSMPLEQIQLGYSQAVRLAAVKLIAADGKETPVQVGNDARQSFALPVPALTPGAYELQWRALSADGHVMSGNFSFTLE